MGFLDSIFITRHTHSILKYVLNSAEIAISAKSTSRYMSENGKKHTYEKLKRNLDNLKDQNINKLVRNEKLAKYYMLNEDSELIPILLEIIEEKNLIINKYSAPIIEHFYNNLGEHINITELIVKCESNYPSVIKNLYHLFDLEFIKPGAKFGKSQHYKLNTQSKIFSLLKKLSDEFKSENEEEEKVSLEEIEHQQSPQMQNNKNNLEKKYKGFDVISDCKEKDYLNLIVKIESIDPTSPDDSGPPRKARIGDETGTIITEIDFEGSKNDIILRRDDLIKISDAKVKQDGIYYALLVKLDSIEKLDSTSRKIIVKDISFSREVERLY